MLKRMMIDDFLNDNGMAETGERKGVCQKCGHYTLLSQCRIGMKVCSDCGRQLEGALKKDYL